MKTVRMWVELSGNATRWTEIIEEFPDDTTDAQIQAAWEDLRDEVANGGWEVTK